MVSEPDILFPAGNVSPVSIVRAAVPAGDQEDSKGIVAANSPTPFPGRAGQALIIFTKSI
jgi:hypothetical protein